MPVCKKCGQEKETDKFCKSKNTKSGVTQPCKECRNAQNREEYKDVPDERKKKKHRREYELNKDKKKQRYLERRHTEEYKKIKRETFRRQCEKGNRKRWETAHKKEIREYFRNYNKKRLAEDPLYYARIRVADLVRKHFLSKNHRKNTKTATLLGCTFEELLAHLGPRPEGSHLDHTCPCAQAQNEEELLKLQHFSNLRWLSAEENLAKLDKRTPEGEEMCRKLLGREWIDKESA